MPRKQNKGIMSPERRQQLSDAVRNAMSKKSQNGNPTTKSVGEIKAFLRRCSPLDVVIAMQEMQHESSL